MGLFQSKDFYLSAFLIANGFELADHYRDKGFTEFFFNDSEELQNLVRKYYSLKSAIEPVKYSQALRALKGIIHSLSASTSNQELNKWKGMKMN